MACILVSACLLGRPCRYDGGSRPAPQVDAWLRARGEPVVAVCPEELGGLGTPRPAAGLVGGDGGAVLDGRARVQRSSNLARGDADLTDAFLSGARRALDQGPDATVAILKARSPSCGCGQTWIDGQLRPGDGVFAALLRRRGVRLHTERDLP